jgi:hypothetical protein
MATPRTTPLAVGQDMPDGEKDSMPSGGGRANEPVPATDLGSAREALRNREPAALLARLRWDTRTRDHVERCIAEGKTRREAIRCLKRYVAREITGRSPRPSRTRRHLRHLLDIHRGIKRGYVFLGTVTAAALVIWLRS